VLVDRGSLSPPPLAHRRSAVNTLLQCVAVCCSALQCVAVRCSAVQCVAVRFSDADTVSISLAKCCSVLQSVAVCCSLLVDSSCMRLSPLPLAHRRGTVHARL